MFFKYLLCIVVILGFVFVSSCEKEEEIDTCEDGLLSPGEEQVDCGGPCPPCPESDPTPFAFADINGSETQFGDFILEKFDDWVINFKNDTIDITLNLGDGDSLGMRPLKAEFSKGKLYTVEYDDLANGICLFTDIDHENKTLSFFFEAEFATDPDSPFHNPLDTLKVTKGDFENIPW